MVNSNEDVASTAASIVTRRTTEEAAEAARNVAAGDADDE